MKLWAHQGSLSLADGTTCTGLRFFFRTLLPAHHALFTADESQLRNVRLCIFVHASALVSSLIAPTCHRQILKESISPDPNFRAYSGATLAIFSHSSSSDPCPESVEAQSAFSCPRCTTYTDAAAVVRRAVQATLHQLSLHRLRKSAYGHDPPLLQLMITTAHKRASHGIGVVQQEQPLERNWTTALPLLHGIVDVAVVDVGGDEPIGVELGRAISVVLVIT